MHNLLFCAHKLCMNYVTNTLLLVSSSVRSKELLCSVHRQGQKSEQKHITKKFVGFHNLSPLLTMVKSRIDFFLISKHLTKFVKKVDIQTSKAPDHNMILLSLSWPNENPRGPGFSKFNNSLLEDKEYTAKILYPISSATRKISSCK